MLLYANELSWAILTNAQVQRVYTLACYQHNFRELWTLSTFVKARNNNNNNNHNKCLNKLCIFLLNVAV